ncbi:MAG: hypothetical protein KAR64_07035 [Thermoplasmatales archaeon]|nr:hypothetical protein [Thermoplasmatales archaeon]
MKINSIIGKGATLGIILLFIGIAVQPGITTALLDEEINEEEKEYLFQTIIDVANNPDVKDLLKQNNHNKFNSDYDFKGLYSELLVKNPEIFASMLATKPSITQGYLDKIFNIGVEMVDIIGEEQLYEIQDTIMVSNTEVYGEVKNIIFNDEELSNRIDILFDLIRLIICLALLAIMMPVVLAYSVLSESLDFLTDLTRLYGICSILYYLIVFPLLALSVALLGLTGAICLEYDTCFS